MKELSKYIDIKSIDIIINGVPKTINSNFVENIQNENLIMPSEKIIIHEINLDSSIYFGNTVKIKGVLKSIEERRLK